MNKLYTRLAYDILFSRKNFYKNEKNTGENVDQIKIKFIQKQAINKIIIL